jgi:hypothetical protein
MEVLLGHTIGFGDGAATSEYEEWGVRVVPQKEPYFLPPVRRTRCREVEVGINSTPRSDEDVQTAQIRRFHARALLKLSAKELVSQIEVELNLHIGLAQGSQRFPCVRSPTGSSDEVSSHRTATKSAEIGVMAHKIPACRTPCMPRCIPLSEQGMRDPWAHGRSRALPLSYTSDS